MSTSKMSLSFTDSDGEVFTVEDAADGRLIRFSVVAPDNSVNDMFIFTKNVEQIVEMFRKVAADQKVDA